MTEEEKEVLGAMSEEEKKLMGKRIKHERLKNGFTQDDVAEKFGMKRTNITNYEAGRVIPPGNILKGLSILFGVTSDFLLGKDELNETEEDNTPVIAAHIDDDLTEEELEGIRQYIDFIKSQRK